MSEKKPKREIAQQEEDIEEFSDVGHQIINEQAPKTLLSELNRIQRDLKAPKDQKNTYGGFNYRSAEDILEAYKKVAGDTVVTSSDELWQIGERIYVKSNVTFEFGSETKTVTAFAREPDVQKGMNESQITGSASSYAKKYALNSLFAIDDSKDADFTQDEMDKINEMERHEAEISMIDDLDTLKNYWETNKGLGKEFASLITKRKMKIQNENPQD
jgi:hypothetical protein